MCTLAAYMGDQPAAPILIEMSRRQSGFNGGYYTGIVTLHQGKLYGAKVIGDLEELLEKTDALRLPGTIGIIHSRTDSSGDRSWAHPFFSKDRSLAYAANGYKGLFAGDRDDDGIAQLLEAAGEGFESARINTRGRYPHLKDGRSVHASDLFCQLIHYHMGKGCGCPEAMEQAFKQFPSEIVGLALHAGEDRISFLRYNMPMTVGRTQTETFLASCAMAFPADRSLSQVFVLPAQSFGTIDRTGVNIRVLKGTAEVAGLSPERIRRGWDAVTARLSNSASPASFQELRTIVSPLWSADRPAQREQQVYEILSGLSAQGRLQVEPIRLPGSKERPEPSMQTTQFRMCLKEERPDAAGEEERKEE